MKLQGKVCIVEDDPMVRQSLAMLLESLGVAVASHASGRDFLDDPRCGEYDCVILDVRMPGLGGLEVQDRMAERGLAVPIIFITGHGDVPMAVEAMRGGAVDFLQKPFSNQVLLERVGQAIARSRDQSCFAERRQAAEARLAALSPREREVLGLLVDGRMNKAIAAELGISAKTVEDHRASIMRKMQVRSLAALVQAVMDARRPSA
ncbi:MAG: DNA-binding response regulator [Betaproteobacteria bacterium HGW-Betaproteobacteria-12]|nr:MAG: DNA-binding response regulator [Betaproteobacteria bacterium HGW-Betaproteobacteria-12]